MLNPFTESWHMQMDGLARSPESRCVAVGINGAELGEVWVTPFVLARGAALGDLRGAISTIDDGCNHVLLEALDPSHAGGELRSFYVLLSAPGFELPNVPGPFAHQYYLQLELGSRTFVATTRAPCLGGGEPRIHPTPSHPRGAGVVHGDVSLLEPLTAPRISTATGSGLDLSALRALLDAPAVDPLI